MRKLDAATRKACWRGARLGAISLGLVSFATGVAICIAWKLPIPPIAVTEIGVLVGGCSGAAWGYVWCFPAGRALLRGLMTGAVCGLPVAGLLYGQLDLGIWAACVGLSSLIGYQFGSNPARISASGWRLYRR